MRVAVLTDSNSGMSLEDARENGIELMSMPVMINGKTYMENVDITNEQFYEFLKQDAEVSTSQPSIGEMTDHFDALLKEHDQVVFIPMSSGLSGTCQTASMLAQDYDGKVQVVDNRRISVTQRQSALDAKLLADEGADAKTIKEKLEADAGNSSIYITVDTLKYLKKGGRITPAAAAIGTLLNIKPVLQIQGSKLDSYAKSRGMASAKKIMLKAIHLDLSNRFAQADKAGRIHIAGAYTSDKETADAWIKQVQDEFPMYPVHFDPLPVSIGCHIGHGSLAVTVSSFLPERKSPDKGNA